jgi:hypothetical protein
LDAILFELKRTLLRLDVVFCDFEVFLSLQQICFDLLRDHLLLLLDPLDLGLATSHDLLTRIIDDVVTLGSMICP